MKYQGFRKLLRNALWLLLAVLVIAGQFAFGQDRSDDNNRTEEIDKIERAIRSGDTRNLMTVATGKIIVKLFDEEKLYSQSQARYVLEEFFDSNPARAFRFLEISAPERSQFAIGTMLAANGELLEIYVRLRQNGPNWLLREIRIRPMSRAASMPDR